MTIQDSTSILTDDEGSVIELLQYIHADAEDFEDPENGDYLDRMEKLLRDSNELDATIVKLALDRTHFFMGRWMESSFSGDSYTVIPADSPATGRLRAALDSTAVIESTGLKKEILEIVDKLQVDYFWRDSENPDAKTLRDLTELVVVHNIKDAVLADFVQWNILFPWNEHLGIQYTALPAASEHAEWIAQGQVLTATHWGKH